MKKLLSQALLFSALVFAGTGCLKDKGFENNEYGIKDPSGSPAGVGFALGLNEKNSRAVEVGTNQSIADISIINEAGTAPTQDIHITLVVDPTIVTSYNAKYGTSTVVLPTTAYSFPTTITIPAGKNFTTFSISIPNTTNLNLSTEYGIGIRIASVDGGYQVARNLRNLFVGINIKNKYDGKYNSKGFFNHPSYSNPYSTAVQLWTTGPNSIVMYSPQFDEFSRPFNVGGGSYNRFADISPVFTVDPTTNKVTVVNYFSAGSALTVDPAYNNRYDPASKTFFVKYGYNAARTRDWTDTLTYLGPR